MDDALVKAVEAADGPWPVLAIFIIGLYVLVWKFGGQVISLLKANHEETKAISESIVTNHGSKNIGDAIDRLTESVHDIQDRLARLEKKGR